MSGDYWFDQETFEWVRVTSEDGMSPQQAARAALADWKKPSPFAAPYLRAMLNLSDWRGSYGCDHATDIGNRFLCNARAWRGPVAREVKAKIKKAMTTQGGEQ